MDYETLNRNIIAVHDYTKETRKLFRELETEFKNTKKLCLQQQQEIAQLKQQVAILQAKTYR